MFCLYQADTLRTPISFTCCSHKIMQNESNQAPNLGPRVWYKEPYLWMLVGFPVASILACIFLIFLAATTKDTLVRDNYYKDGLAINQELAWDKKAVSMDIRLDMIVDGNKATLTMTNSRIELPSTLILKFSHPTLQTQDRDSLLQRVGQEKTYQGFIENLQDGRYYLQVESLEQQWRVRKDDAWVKNGVLLSL